MYSVATNSLICEAYKRREAANGKFTVCNLCIELTRRCNLQCAHCMKGDAEDLDIKPEYIDTIMSQVGLIYCFSLTGGEITLCPDLFRYVLESARSHGVRIKRIVVTINAVKMSPEFLSIFRDFSAYTEMPYLNEIRISNDRFHVSASRMTDEDYQIRKSFYQDVGKNTVQFQNCCNMRSFNLKRVGRCSHIPKMSGVVDSKEKDQYIAYSTGEIYPLFRRDLRGVGNHLCNLYLTATGKIMTNDIISFADEDLDRYNNGDIMTSTLKEILRDQRQNINALGRFSNLCEDFRSLKSQFHSLVGFAGLGLFFVSDQKKKRINEISSAMYEVLKQIDEYLPEVKKILEDPETTKETRVFFQKSIGDLEKNREKYLPLFDLFED